MYYKHKKDKKFTAVHYSWGEINLFHERMISMKRYISALVALTLTAASMTMLPATAAGELLHSGFESGADGWTSRGSATVTQSTASASSGSGCLSITDRSENWAGAGISLDTATFKPGETYSFSAMVSQSASPMAVHFKLSLEYSTGSGGVRAWSICRAALLPRRRSWSSARSRPNTAGSIRRTCVTKPTGC